MIVKGAFRKILRNQQELQSCKIYYREGCAHQPSVIASVGGGPSPPYTYLTGIKHRLTPTTTFRFGG